ncbi:polymer-forming cytoskeletal protein [Myxococcus sp. K15C18031901]|uniref:polymer-forming cytoskeletal protein n=1 Tax=Myxococcus dinghuensis TaxID=2906761 RepID=UPI0020A82C59|nr:polymer-forming cytoskeletal protein [Myxococcus dinghuensis]MCP3103977.1 polymer-forming cytoskeletal protein [Myxococcus dinghuensis]
MPTPKQRGSKTRQLSTGTLTAESLPSLLKQTLRGKFAKSSTLRAAKRFIEERLAGARADSDILHHTGRLVLDELTTGRKPRIGLLVVEGDLVVKGRYEDSLDPESVVVVTGSLRAGDVITRGFLEVHGDLVAERSILFLDNEACTEVFGSVRAPFVYTNSHAVKVHGGVKARLVTGDGKYIRSQEKHTFIEETETEVRDRLSPKLLKRFADEMFEAEEGEEVDPDEPWIDALDTEKLVAFVRRGQSALAQPPPSRRRK